MGSELVSDSFSVSGDGQNKSVPVSFYSEFEKCLPTYLSIGMTSSEYWDGDCRLVISYRKAHEIRTSRMNQEAWLMGAYIYDALCCVSPVLHAFAKPGTKPFPYPKEPHPITEEEAANQKAREERQRYEEMKQETIKRMERINARFKPGGGGENG